MTYSDYEWSLKQDFSKFTGEWLAIIDKKIVATNKKLQTVLNLVDKKHPNKEPFLIKVNTKL